MARLFDELIKYGASDYYGFHMPGHKRNDELIAGAGKTGAFGRSPGGIFPYACDITEIDGFDDLNHPLGIIREEQERAARIFGAEHARFLVNGSTAGLLAAISAVSEGKRKIIISRGCHKSVYNGVILSGLEPVYILSDGVCRPRDVLDALGRAKAPAGNIAAADTASEKAPADEIAAIVITSPTYEGETADVAAISRISRETGVPLIVDQAHGAHFGFNDYFPESAARLGADIVVTSLHKTLPSLTQTALLLANGRAVDIKQVDKYLRIFQSSSPSYVLMGSISKCVSMLEDGSDEMFTKYITLLDKFTESCAGLKRLHLLTRDEVKRLGAFEFDRSKLVITVGEAASGGEFDGLTLCGILRDVYHIELEAAFPGYVIGMTSPADTAAGFTRLAAALFEIDGRLGEERKARGLSDEEGKSAGFGRGTSEGGSLILHARPAGTFSRPVTRMTPAEAFKAREIDVVDINQAAGRISAELVYMYPPGIPFIVPGEEITREITGMITEQKNRGYNITGAADETLKTLRVVKEGDLR